MMLLRITLCWLQKAWHMYWLVLIRLLPGVSGISDMEELCQAFSRGPFAGYVCLRYHSQRLLRLGNTHTGLHLGRHIL